MLKKLYLLTVLSFVQHVLFSQVIEPNLQDEALWTVVNRKATPVTDNNKKGIRFNEVADDGLMILKGADFFDAATYPHVKFAATKYENIDQDGSYDLYGDLTIKDVTKQVKLAVEFGGIAKDPWGNVKAGFTISGKINRKEFGLTWNAATETGGVLVSEEVKIHAEIQLIEQQ